MTNSTSEREQRLNKLRERKNAAIAAAVERYEFRPLPSWGDVDFLLSLLDSEAASRADSEIAADIVREWSEHEMDESYGSQYLHDEFGAGHLEGRIASALAQRATSMRDLCVEKVKALRGGWERELEYKEDFDWRVDTATKIITALQSLTLEQVEQKTK